MQRFAMNVVRLAALLVAGTSFAAPAADLDRYAERMLQTFGTPGMTVAIVERGRPYVIRSLPSSTRLPGSAVRTERP
jgi:CubicO group peptidase (beta-lactamase class C family)